MLMKSSNYIRAGLASLTLSLLIFGTSACSSQPERVDPGTSPVRNEACMTECKAKKCEAYAGCEESCEAKGMAPAIAACQNQCEIKFRYCDDACASECDARYPG